METVNCPGCEEPTGNPAKPNGIGVAVLVWIASVALLFVFQLVAVLIYVGISIARFSERPRLAVTPGT